MANITLGGNKHLLPLWDRTVIHATTEGLQDFCLVTNPEAFDEMSYLFPSVPVFLQTEPRGIADAILSAKALCYQQPISVLLGDNLFTGPLNPLPVETGARVTLFDHPEWRNRFGVACLSQDGDIYRIEEKPEEPIPAPGGVRVITGLYSFDASVWDRLYAVGMSSRNEKEIMPVLQSYLAEGTLNYREHQGQWTDLGTSPSSYTRVLDHPNVWDRRLSHA
jgi:glucose-1-phosphate thymidylyltransferase